ncbi:RAN guanine nucleotide release factor [Cryptosporidium sp. chipmunk genotype I]|uniref:RAN guanine nucleotide release factor n=1 Tax=Cryptosporidium sp. chipmunk genotype I TaxID=1280935 RepID=UPI00351A605D|nr:RAN guanine nucleotide release factor [Cryptosporidium sp. chipmunk genotype I]
MEYTNRKLYGGAIELNIPKEFDDISNVRDIPDHQEVFVDKLSECSIIVEILDLVDSVGRGNVAEYYFKDISEFNNSLDTKIIYSEPLSAYSNDLQISKCIGSQILDKRYPEGIQREELNLYLLLLRIVPKRADIVISFNSPSRFPAINQSLQTKTEYRRLSEKDINEIMDEILRSFAIKDYNLFV